MSPDRVLVVDDDPQIRRVLRSTLSANGYEVHATGTGEEAIDHLRRNRANLVLLDVNMPGMTGIEACREIRRSSEAAIIMLTVSDSEEEKVAALDAGADDYITKPFGTPELLARMRAALRRLPVSGDRADQVLEFGDLQINSLYRRVTVRGRDIRLTPKEFELLQYLTARPNLPLSHAEILQAIWGPEYSGEVQYLRVFVNQLRKKIERDPSHPCFILTEPWVGYRFAVTA